MISMHYAAIASAFEGTVLLSTAAALGIGAHLARVSLASPSPSSEPSSEPLPDASRRSIATLALHPLAQFLLVCAIVYVNQVLFGAFILRAHGGSTSFIGQYIPGEWFAIGTARPARRPRGAPRRRRTVAVADAAPRAGLPRAAVHDVRVSRRRAPPRARCLRHALQAGDPRARRALVLGDVLARRAVAAEPLHHRRPRPSRDRLPRRACVYCMDCAARGSQVSVARPRARGSVRRARAPGVPRRCRRHLLRRARALRRVPPLQPRAPPALRVGDRALAR